MMLAKKYKSISSVYLLMLMISFSVFAGNLQLHNGGLPQGVLQAEWQAIQTQIKQYQQNQKSVTNVTQQTYVKASNTGGDTFGFSVALYGDTLVVGAPDESSSATGVNGNQIDNSAMRSGAVYVFTRDSGVWNQQAYLKASNTGANDFFGHTVAISGDTIVVGAIGESSNATGVNGDEFDNSADSAGSAYVFVRNAGVWSQQAYLKASNTNANDRFGSAVAISVDTIVIGASNESNTEFGSGATYIFSRSVNTWSQQAYLKSTDNIGFTNLDHFGDKVAIFGDTVVIGAPFDSSNATGVNGDQNNNLAVNSGSAYIFVNTAGSWNQQAYLKSSNSEADDQFGSSVSIDGDTIVIGAIREDSVATGVNGDQSNNSANASGAVYVFVRNTGIWSQQAYLKASNPDTNNLFGDQFGTSVSIDGDSIVVGARWEESNAIGIDGDGSDNSIRASGAAYSFVRQGNNWVPEAYIKASNTQQTGDGDWFGTSVAMSGQTLVIGAPWEDSNATGINGDESNEDIIQAGAVYVYTQSSGLNFSVGGSVSGLASGNSVTLQNNFGDDLIISADGNFTFGLLLADASDYLITVSQQPTTPNQVCALSNESGTIAGANIINVMVVCTTNTYTIGGTIVGLASGNDVILQNNGSDDLLVSSNGDFIFSTAIDDGSNYNVTALTQPTTPNQVCTLSNESGTIAGANIINVMVVCTTNSYTIGGTIVGLAPDNDVILQNNGSDDLLVSSNGDFIFSTAIDDGSNYNVTALTQPTTPSQTCQINNGQGMLLGADIISIIIVCTNDPLYSIGGSLSGLISGDSLLLQNNGSDDLLVVNNGIFTFDTELLDGSAYEVTIEAQPTSPELICSISNGNGNISMANITDVEITCLTVQLTLSPDTVDFGVVDFRTNQTQTLNITNTGTGTVTLPSFVDPAPPFYVVGGTCNNNPLVLIPSETCSLNIEFRGDEIGSFTAQMQVISNASSSPDNVNLSATVLVPVIPVMNVFGLLLLAILVQLLGWRYKA